MQKLKNNSITLKEFYELEIAAWKMSDHRKAQITGDNYYNFKHDILKRKREVIGEGGKLQTVDNLPNNKLIDNQYGTMVDQKKNYLLGNGFTIETTNERYHKVLKTVFGTRFHRTFKNLGEDALNGAIGWLCIYYNDDGKLSFKRFAPYEILPFWKDSEHTELDAVVRVYEVEVYEGKNYKTIEKVEIYTNEGVEYYELQDAALRSDPQKQAAQSPEPYFQITSGDKVTDFNWGRIPVIPFKYNSRELPLISYCKSLQDAINTLISDFMNVMQEDPRNSLLILKEYDGQNLGEFRRNLAVYGVIKVRGEGDVKVLTIEVNSENYQVILEELKKALIKNCRGYDAKDDRLMGNPNQMNIQSMYSDIDLDANEMETEFQASFEEVLYFINIHLSNTGKGDFEGEDVNIIFKRDITINTSEVMEMLYKGGLQISNETLISQVPFIDDVKEELGKLRDEEARLSLQDYTASDNTNAGNSSNATS